MKRKDLPDLLFALQVLIVLVFAVAATGADPDLWGHVRFGQDILTAHAVSWLDPYSFTSDRPWINHEWLAEALMAGSYGLAGSAGLTGLKWMLAIGAFVVLWRTLRRAGVYQLAAEGLVLVAIVGVYPLVMTIRPQLFSVFLYTILLALINAAGHGRRRLLFWMPVLFACWANLHGGWIVGLSVLGLWSASAFLAGTMPWPWAAGGTLLGLLGTLATPYGVGLWRFLWATVGLGRADIIEWQPLFRKPALLIVWTLTASLIAIAWRRRGRTALPLLLPAAVLAVLALRVVRLEGFFALTAVMLLAPCFAALGPRRLPLSRRPTAAELLLVGAMCAVEIVGTGVAASRRAGCVTIAGSEAKEPWAPEAEAVVFLRSNPIQGRLLCYFDYGQLAIWHLAPDVRVSYDGRRETVYSEVVQNAHQRFQSEAPDAGYARRLKADYVWLPRRLPVIDLLKRDGWVEIFRGARSVVLAQTGGPYTQPVPWTGPRCFPGP